MLLVSSSLGSSGFIWLLNGKCHRAFTDEMEWGTYCGFGSGQQYVCRTVGLGQSRYQVIGGTAKDGVSQ